MARMKRQEVIDRLDTTREELLGFLDKVVAGIGPFAAVLEDAFEAYNPQRVAAAVSAIETAKMHVDALFTEVPHRPASARPPVVQATDEE